jgi:hypothetical protein
MSLPGWGIVEGMEQQEAARPIDHRDGHRPPALEGEAFRGRSRPLASSVSARIAQVA